MGYRKALAGVVSLGVLGGVGAWTFVPRGEFVGGLVGAGLLTAGDDEVEIKLGEAPAAVQAAVGKLTAVGNVKKVVKEMDEGVATYEVEFTDNGAAGSAVLSEAGEVMEVERATAQDKLPGAVMAALKKEYPRATFADTLLVTKTYYEVQVVIDGKKHEVKCDAAGNIEDGSGEGDEKGEHGKGDGHEEHEKGGKGHDKD